MRQYDAMEPENRLVARGGPNCLSGPRADRCRISSTICIARSVPRVEGLILTAVAVLVGVSGAGFVSLLGVTTNDLVDSIFVLASLLGVLKVAERAGEPADWAWPGLWLGIAFGLKYTAVVFIPGLALIAFIAAARQRSARGLMVFGVAAMLGFLVAAGHHSLTLWRDFGSPVFPLFNNIFQSPYYDPVALRDGQFLPRDFWQAVAYPWFWAQTNRGLVSELQFRDWRGAIAYAAIVAGLLMLAAGYARWKHLRDGAFAETRDLGLVFIFVIVSYFAWEFGFSVYRYAVTLEMLTGVVTMGALIWLFTDPRLRVVISLVLLSIVTTTTVYPDWGRGEYGDRYVDIRVPPLPVNSVVLIASWEPAAYFIPFAEPTAQYLSIENNYLELSQNNKLASEVKRLMQTPGYRPAKWARRCCRSWADR
jgi:Dolichyl-phosphate-mannose-protein mannosyltransferase